MATSGAIEYRSKNLGLGIIRFDFPNWADEANGNTLLIDALLGTFTGNLRGLWAISTVYAVGDRIVSSLTGAIYEVLIAHTSPDTGTLEDELIAFPNRFRLTTSSATFRGAWAPATSYSNNSFVIFNNAYYIATSEHQSSAAFATDLASGKWAILVDLNPFITTISLAASDAITQIDAAVDSATIDLNAIVVAAQIEVNQVADAAIASVGAVVGTVSDLVQEAEDAAALAMQYRDEAAQIADFDPDAYVLKTEFNDYKQTVVTSFSGVSDQFTTVNDSISTINTQITGLDTRLDVLEEGGGGGVPGDLIYPIMLTSPTSGETNVGNGGTYTFVIKADGYSADATGYYSLYGFPQASRSVRVYLASAPTTLVTAFTTAGSGNTVIANFSGVLAVNTDYLAEGVFTDTFGNESKTAKVPFKTATEFKPGVGQAYSGGFMAYPNFGDGLLYDLVVAPKSTEASKAWIFNDAVLRSAFSRLNGPENAAKMRAVNNDLGGAAQYANTISIGGTAGYLGAIDELRAIAFKLKPSAAPVTAFQSGGSEVFVNGNAWSSTELTASNASVTNMTNGNESAGGEAKTVSLPVRAIKRIPAPMPYPIGTAMEGGYLGAYFTDLSSGSPVTSMLIVADKATEVTRQWETSANGAIGGAALSRTNGSAFTEANGSFAGLAALNYCQTLTSGAKTDWYLGAIDEMLAIARVNASLPIGQRLDATGIYWTSTETDASTAKNFTMPSLAEASGSKSTSRLVRPIRRVLLPA